MCIRDRNNQTDYSSGENIYITESCSSTTKQENQTIHSISTYDQDINETQCHDVMTYSQGISPVEPRNNSECSSVISGNTGLYAGSGEEYNSIQQASPDSQQSYFISPDGKLLNLFLNGTAFLILYFHARNSYVPDLTYVLLFRCMQLSQQRILLRKGRSTSIRKNGRKQQAGMCPRYATCVFYYQSKSKYIQIGLYECIKCISHIVRAKGARRNTPL